MPKKSELETELEELKEYARMRDEALSGYHQEVADLRALIKAYELLLKLHDIIK